MEVTDEAEKHEAASPTNHAMDVSVLGKKGNASQEVRQLFHCRVWKSAGRCDIGLPVSTSSRGEAGNRGQYEEHGVSVFCRRRAGYFATTAAVDANGPRASGAIGFASARSGHTSRTAGAAFAAHTGISAIAAGPGNATRAATAISGIAAGPAISSITAGPGLTSLPGRAAITSTPAGASRTAGTSGARLAIPILANAVRAWSSIGFGRVIALTVHHVARAGDVAFIERHANDGHGRGARPHDAAISLGTRIAIITRAPVRLRRIRTHSGGGIAHTRILALISRHACDRIRARACAHHAGIRLRTRIPIITRRTIGFGRVGTHPRHRIARPRVVALVHGHTRDGHARGARSRDATIRRGAVIAVVTRCSVGFGRIGAHPCRRITRPGVAALITRHTRDRIGAYACSSLTNIHLRAGIVVIAGRTIGSIRVRANAGARLAHSGDVTSILSRACGDLATNAIDAKTAGTIRSQGARFTIDVVDVKNVSRALVGGRRDIVERRAEDGRISRNGNGCTKTLVGARVARSNLLLLGP